MFQRHGGVLERGVQVGLRQMAGITGLGEKAEIGQSQTPDGLNLVPNPFQVRLLSEISMNKKEREEDQVDGYV